jgi:hypothetical protein
MSADRKDRLLGLAFAAPPALAMLVAIVFVATDLPFADGWETPGGLLELDARGELSAHHFLAQHNESRPLFPRLLFYGTAQALGWHPKLFMLMSWASSFVVTLIMARWLIESGRDLISLMAILIVSTLVFSMAQHANYLWGMQLVVFVPSSCLILSLALTRSSSSPTRILVGAIVLSFVSTFSYANGMLCWLLAAPFPLLAVSGAGQGAEGRSRVRWQVGIYLLCAALSLLLYFWDYSRPVHHPSLEAALREPAQAGLFFASWLGAPFSDVVWRLDAAAVAGGGILLLTFSIGAVFLLRLQRSQESQGAGAAIPWLALLAYGLISGLVTTVGRLGSGETAALAQRYATQVLWIPVGLTGLACAMRTMRTGAPARAGVAIELVLLAVLAGLAVLSWINGARQLPQYAKQLSQNALSLQLIDVLPENPLLARLHPAPARIAARARLLRERGLLDYRPIGPWIATELPEPEPAVGVIEVRTFAAEGKNGMAQQLLIEGTAVIPDTELAADGVLLRWTGPTEPGRSWTALAINDRDSLTRRRIRFYDLLEAPPDADPSKLVALAIDLDRRRLYRLPRVRN